MRSDFFRINECFLLREKAGVDEESGAMSLEEDRSESAEDVVGSEVFFVNLIFPF